MFGWAPAAEQSGHAATSVGYQGVKFTLFLEEQGRVKPFPCSARAAAFQPALKDLVRDELKTITTKKSPKPQPSCCQKLILQPRTEPTPPVWPSESCSRVRAAREGMAGEGLVLQLPQNWLFTAPLPSCPLHTRFKQHFGTVEDPCGCSSGRCALNRGQLQPIRAPKR